MRPRRCQRSPSLIDVGARLPLGTDAVAAIDAIESTRGSAALALAPVARGDGVLPAGADADPDRPLRLSGERLRAVDLAAFAALGITHVAVRQPRVRLVAARLGDDAVMQAIVSVLSDQIHAAGGEAIVTERTANVPLEAILTRRRC